MALPKSAKAGKRTLTPAKIGKRWIVAIARDERETIVNIGDRRIHQRVHSLNCSAILHT
jgi:hypothetical protein